MYNILIIGGGSIGKRHAKNLVTLGYQDIAIVEINPDRAKEIKTELNISTYPSLEKAYQKKSWDIAFICSPTIYHLEQSIFCANHGSHLFIEKPISHNLENIKDLAEVVKEKNLTTLIGSNWKFYPLFQKMKELIDSGEIGKILSARGQFGQYLPDWHPYEDYRQGYSANKKLGGGILLDCHEIDYLTWFLGDVEKIMCMSGHVSNIEINTEDVAAIIMKFKTGAIGELHVDYIQRTYKRDFQFNGETGTITWDANSKKIILETVEGETQEFPLALDYDFNTMYLDQTKHFFHCIKNNQSTKTDITAAYNVIKIITAAKESAKEDKAIYI